MASYPGPPDEEETSEKPEGREEAVVNETEGVFRHFMYQRFQDESTREEEQGLVDSAASARSDALEELQSCNDEAPENHIVVIGRRLGEVGDEIDAKYKSEFQEMIEQLNLTHATAYETFAAIARRLFRSGINWGRIVALLCFGYEIAVSVIRQGLSGNFLRRIIRFVVDFVFRERIARWIAEHGGWYTSLQNSPKSQKYATLSQRDDNAVQALSLIGFVIALVLLWFWFSTVIRKPLYLSNRSSDQFTPWFPCYQTDTSYMWTVLPKEDTNSQSVRHMTPFAVSYAPLIIGGVQYYYKNSAADQ